MNFVQRDKAVIWHPFTSQKDVNDPIHIERAEGVWLYTSDGRKIIDGISSWWVNIHGHSHPYIARKIADQAKNLEQVIFAGFTHTPAIELAEKLVKVLPGQMCKVFYSDNGSTSVEVGLKIALQFWHNKNECRLKIIAFENAYHGDTFGAMSVGARSLFTAAFEGLMFEVIRMPVPSDENITACKNQLQALCSDNDVAAFIFEPLIQGAGGMLMHKAEHLDELLCIAKAHGVICIADEVMTGFGRTGKLFACDHLVNQPDIVCVSKGITGGFLPLGVTVCDERVFGAFDTADRTKTFFHGHSYTANPISCAAALASLELLTSKDCLEQIDLISRRHQYFVESVKSNSVVKDARCQGTVLAIELKTPEDSSYFNSIRDEIYRVALERGVLLRPLGNVVYCMPAYCMQENELNVIYETMLHVIEVVRCSCRVS